MATRNVSLTETLDGFVEAQVASGDFGNASEVVREGLRLLKKQTEEDAARLARFNRLVQEGIDDIEAGRFEVVEWDQLDEWLDGLGRRRTV